jgi:hypothetical protein
VTSNPRPDWTQAHVLAGFSLMAFIVVVALESYFSDRPLVDGAHTPLHPVLRSVIGGPAALAAIWFWVLMVADYIRERPAKNSGLWGVVLCVGLYPGALGYFWRIWRPRHRVELNASAV